MLLLEYCFLRRVLIIARTYRAELKNYNYGWSSGRGRCNRIITVRVYTPPFFFRFFFYFFHTKRAIDDDMSWQTGDRDGPRCKALLDRRWCCKFKVAVANTLSSEKIARCSDNGPPAYSQGDERIVRRANKNSRFARVISRSDTFVFHTGFCLFFPIANPFFGTFFRPAVLFTAAFLVGTRTRFE